LSRLLSLACEEGLLNKKPKIKLLREENQRNRYLKDSEEYQLLKSLETSRIYLRPLVILGIDTGMRLGEIENLRWPDIDFQRETIYVAKSKTGKPRSIPMTNRTKELLLSLRTNERESVFENLPGISMAFRKACRKAGIVNFHFHDLRHTFATRLAESGADVATIAALLGHSSIQMAMRYSHITDDRIRRSVKALDNYGQMSSQIYVKTDNVRMMA